MKIWYNKLNESRRTLVDLEADEIHIGRDPANDVVLKSPLVSRRHAILRRIDGQLSLENVGVNSCLVGETEVLGGERVTFSSSVRVRIWPYTLSFETDARVGISRQELEAHLRSLVADVELKIHQTLLERLDVYDMKATGGNDRETILLLENNIEDVCRELKLFDVHNEAVIEEIVGLSLRDYLINQLIMETGDEQVFDLAVLTTNEFDVPATLVPERETELHALLQFARERMQLETLPDVSSKIHCVEDRFLEVFQLLRPHLHHELRKYILLRMLKKDLKDIAFGFGPLQDLLRAPTISEIMVVRSDQIYVERSGVIEKSGRRFISDKVTESILERIVAQVGRRIDRSQPLVDARLPDGSRVNAIIPPLAVFGPCLTVRKFPIQRLTMDDLIEWNTLSKAAATFLRASVIDRRSILISGGTGSGKTTMLNVVSSFIPYKERIVTIEDTCELRLHQEHVVALESRPPNVEGGGGVPRRRGIGHGAGHEHGARRIADHRPRQQCGRGGPASGTADADGRRAAHRLDPPPDGLGPGSDRAPGPPAGRASGGQPDRRGDGRASRDHGRAGRGSLQPPQRAYARTDRPPAVVHRFPGGQEPAGPGVSVRALGAANGLTTWRRTWQWT